MPAMRLGGRGRLMREAVAFARSSGFVVRFSQGGHLIFEGHGQRVVAPGTPRSSRASTAAIARMRAVLRSSA